MANAHAEKYSDFLEGLAAYLDRKPALPHRRKGRDLGAILAWHDQPTGEPLQTNWRTAANDNRAHGADVDQEEAQYSTETVREIVPGGNRITLRGAITASVKRAEYRDVPMADFGKKKGEHETFRYPVGGDVEYGTHVDDKGERHKVVVRIGKLRFSDGTQTEMALVRDATGKVVEKRVRMPVGAMLGTKERTRQEKGGAAVWGASNRIWSAMLNSPQPAKKLKAGPVRRGRSIGRTEAAKMLADAYANTPVLPEIKRCPAGLPYSPPRVADMFLAGKKSTCAGGGAASWQETASALVSATEWRKARAELSDADVAVLDASMTAKNYGDIGAAVGKSRKAGPRLLRGSNDNLAAAIKKFVA
ncbi:hypothetical protein [Mesorhizobium sp. CAU 1732]|uniref:hypothetical protein n=1 Tax=Mesorhizobium sp. CAU 1732 TaxID=3140358 RepID=UPI003260086B